jgi:sugar phosphate isomerase/epimerase
VGHTTYYLPFASPVNSIRDAAIHDVIRSLTFFKEAGAAVVTVHPDPGVGAIETKTTISLNALSFKIISDEAAKHDITIVVENVPGVFSSVDALNSVFSSVPGLGFHLDVGHAFIRRNRFRHLLSAFKDRLTHIHLSDNRGREDDHMPLGAGNIDWNEVVAAIKKTGYDATFTLEIFSNDRRYVLGSRDKFKEIWQSC